MTIQLVTAGDPPSIVAFCCDEFSEAGVTNNVSGNSYVQAPIAGAYFANATVPFTFEGSRPGTLPVITAQLTAFDSTDVGIGVMDWVQTEGWIGTIKLSGLWMLPEQGRIKVIINQGDPGGPKMEINPLAHLEAWYVTTPTQINPCPGSSL